MARIRHKSKYSFRNRLPENKNRSDDLIVFCVNHPSIKQTPLLYMFRDLLLHNISHNVDQLYYRWSVCQINVTE